ncbi:MAG: MATE family efflux transporter [Clostridium fessum]
MTTFSAQNLGAKEYDRIPKGLRKMLVIAEIYIILTAVVVLFCRHPLLGIFLKPNETEALRQGMSYLVPMASFTSSVVSPIPFRDITGESGT